MKQEIILLFFVKCNRCVFTFLCCYGILYCIVYTIGKGKISMTVEEFDKKYSFKLNKQQNEAVHTVDGSVLLLAVPGSGKTTVLVTRLGYMIYCKNIAPASILTMTYTVAATKEMKQRFASMFGEEYAPDIEFRTINGISSKIIAYYSRNYGKGQPFELLENEGEIASILRDIYMKKHDEYPVDGTIKDIRTAITYIKNMMLKDEEIEKLDYGVDGLLDIYKRYCHVLKSRKQMDYDDQMSYALTILNSYPQVLSYFKHKYRYICVDEAQDTSKIQHEIIKVLAGRDGNIFMVGDEDQSIYGFRAAYPDALMTFENDYDNAKILLMEENYRSSKEIVALADDFVSRNHFRHEKHIKPTRGSVGDVNVINANSRLAQYKYLFALAENCKTETAVLYRNNDSALPIIDLLERNGIAYNCKKFDEVFFSNRVVNDIADIIHFAYNLHDSETFMRIYYKFGVPIAKNAAVHACERSRQSGKTILEELIYAPQMKSFTKEFAFEMNRIIPEIPKDNAETAVWRIWYDLRYGKYVERNSLDAGKYSILYALAKLEKDARGLLRRLGELKELIKNHQNQSQTKFILSTIHSSKGLEYDSVYLLDMFDGILPSTTESEVADSDEMRLYEEDRRIYYVAMTRAKDSLALFKCEDKHSSFTDEAINALPQEEIDENDIFFPMKMNLCGKTYTDRSQGRGVVMACSREHYLVEFENGILQLMTAEDMLMNRDKTIRYAKKKPVIDITKRTADDYMNKSGLMSVHEGSIVQHKVFGRGVVEAIDGDIAEIKFTSTNEVKKLLLSACFDVGVLKVVY